MIASTIRARCVRLPMSRGVVGRRTLPPASELRCFCITADCSTLATDWTLGPASSASWSLRIRQFLLIGGGGSRGGGGLLVAALAGPGRPGGIGKFAGVVILEAERVDHRADHQREAEHVEPEQGDEDEAEG